MKESIGKRSVNIFTRVAIAAALKITSLFVVRTPANAAKIPTPHARNSIDSYMLEAGMRPAAIHRIASPQVMTAAPAISRIDERYRKTAMTLGANRFQTAWVVLREARFGIAAANIAAFGRVISEVGISMMLGGNIKGFTRTMTTAMALEYDKGSFTLAVALGMVLLALSFGMNLIFNFVQGKSNP